MKYLKLLPIFIMAFAMFTLTSCDDEPLEGEFGDGSGSGGGNANISSIYDQWWYDSEDFTADVYFHSDGRYEQKIVLLGIEIEGTGDWYWEDENQRIMKIENLAGQGQTVSQAWYKFNNIQTSSFKLKQSTSGSNYSDARLYLDTDN